MTVWRYNNDINTDMLFPGKYTYTCSTAEEIKPHLLEDLDESFAKEVGKTKIPLLRTIPFEKKYLFLKNIRSAITTM